MPPTTMAATAHQKQDQEGRRRADERQRDAAAAATPPSTHGPSPPMMTRPSRAGKRDAERRQKKRGGPAKAVLDREPAAEAARVHQLEQGGRRFADRQDEHGEERQPDQDRAEADDNRFRPAARAIRG